MAPMDLYNALRRTPFEPFRIHLTDGTKYDVLHPELVMPGLTVAIIGFPTNSDQPKFFGTTETVALSHIVRLEPIVQSSTSS